MARVVGLRQFVAAVPLACAQGTGTQEAWIMISRMDSPNDARAVPDGSRYATPQRRELAGWLKDRAPSFLEGYLAAIRLLYTPSFPARVHLICHVVRDIYRFLPAALGGKRLSRPGEVFPGMAQRLATLWERFPPSGEKHPERGSPVVSLHAAVYDQVAEIVDKSRQMARDRRSIGRELAVALFHSGDRRDDEFIAPWIIESFDHEYDFFVTRAHLAQRADRVPTDDGLVEQFEAFERAFHSLIGSYFTGKEELDAILQDTNTATD
jgi:hypothetical protein